MKKYLIILLCGAILFSMSGCNNSGASIYLGPVKYILTST